MRNASGHQSKNERQQKKVNRTTYNISAIKRVTGKFLGVSRCRRAKQRQRNVQKKGAASEKFLFFFANYTYFLFLFCLFVFVVFIAVAVAVWLALHDFIFCFSKL